MNIESLHVENFKSIRELDVEFSNLNVFVGPNAAGKSNIFEVFSFLYDMDKEGSADAIQLRGGVEYLRNTRIGDERSTKIDTKFEPDSEYKLVNSESIHRRQEQVVSRSLTVELFFDGDVVNWPRSVYDISVSVKKEQESYENRVLHLDFIEDRSRIRVEPGNRDDIEEVLIEPDVANNPEGVPGVDSALTETPDFEPVFDISPKAIKNGNSLKGKANLQSEGSNLALVIKKLLENEEQKRKFVGLVSDVLPFVSDTKVDAMPDQSLFLQILENFDPDEDQYIPAEMLSDGTLHVLALIYILYFSDYEKVFIEEPGRNIHPSLIANLMMKVKDAAENTDKQIFLTTHNVEVVKYAPLESIRLVSRDDDGFTQVEKPAESERVQTFLDEGVRIDDMYTENLLGE